MAYPTLTYQQLQSIADKVKEIWFDEYIPEYLSASELAHYIKIYHQRPSCSAQEVNKALRSCFGDTKNSEHWEIPQIVPNILYKKNSTGYYHWHKILIDVIDDQIFGKKDPSKLEYTIFSVKSQQFSNN